MTEQTYAELPPASLSCRKQVRTHFDPEPMDGLIDTVRELGVLQPIRVKKQGDGYVVVDGERRLRAARLAGLATVPVVIEAQELDAGQVVQRQLVANCQREDLKPLEQAAALKLLIESTGWTAAAAAKKLGLSPASVSRSLALLELPPELQQKLAAGEIAASAAYELARVANPARQSQLAGELTAGKLTRDGLRGSRKWAVAPIDPANGVPVTPVTRLVIPLDKARSITLTGGCASIETLIQWLEELLAKARRVRQQGLALPTFVKMLRDQARGDQARGGV